MKTRLTILLSLLVLLVMGCGNQGVHDDAGLDTSTCAADVDDCAVGLFFGECAGESALPIFACEASGRCRWYRGGCPVGSEASNCPATDICCHVTADGAWPYASWHPSASSPHENMLQDLSALRTLGVVDGTAPREIEVAIDPDLAPASDEVACTGAPPLEICSYDRIRSRGRLETELALLLSFAAHDMGAERVWLELVRNPAIPVARTFVRTDVDSSRLDPPTACPEPATRPTRGTVRLSTADLTSPSLHGVLTMEFEPGHDVTLEF